jgi:hypothetical protein
MACAGAALITTRLYVDVPNVYMAAKSKLGHLRTSKGYNTGGLYGTVRSINAMSKRFDPEQIFLAFEGVDSAIERRRIYPEYKGDRDRSRVFWDEDHLDMIQRWGFLYGCYIAQETESEADDMIAWAVRRCSMAFPDVYQVIMSKDHDMKRLLATSNIAICPGVSEPCYEESDFQQEHGFSARHYGAYLALAGDATDNLEAACSAKTARMIMDFFMTQMELGSQEDRDRFILDTLTDAQRDVLDRNIRVLKWRDRKPEPWRVDEVPDVDLASWYELVEFKSMLKEMDESKHGNIPFERRVPVG